MMRLIPLSTPGLSNRQRAYCRVIAISQDKDSLDLVGIVSLLTIALGGMSATSAVSQAAEETSDNNAEIYDCPSPLR